LAKAPAHTAASTIAFTTPAGESGCLIDVDGPVGANTKQVASYRMLALPQEGSIIRGGYEESEVAITFGLERYSASGIVVAAVVVLILRKNGDDIRYGLEEGEGINAQEKGGFKLQQEKCCDF